jgi:hypothetical protein
MDLSRYGPGVSPLAAALANYQSPNQPAATDSPSTWGGGGGFAGASPAGGGGAIAPYASPAGVGQAPAIMPVAAPGHATDNSPLGLPPGLGALSVDSGIPPVYPLAGNAGATAAPLAIAAPQSQPQPAAAQTPQQFGFGMRNSAGLYSGY